MRAEETRKKHEIERLNAKNEESARAAVRAQTAERAATAEVKKVEKAMRSLQDQATRLKTTLAQVRTQCTNDVRKRDLELARLKTHLQGQQRGKTVGVTAPSITITGGGGVRKTAAAGFDASVHDLGDPEYSLRQETTEFLTQLSQSLSDENDQLITLMRGSLSTMRELLGLPAGQKHPDSAIGSMGSVEDGKLDTANSDSMCHALPTSYETIAADVHGTLAHLQSVLTNPNFVSVEEVEVREEEIVRLREGWERMEQRWKDVLMMMEGWRRKMDTGRTIDLEDLRHGMGLVSPEQHGKGVGVRAVEEEEEQSFVNGAADVSEIRVPSLQQDGLDSSSLMLEPPTLRSSTTGNGSPGKRKRDALEPPEFFDLRPSGQTPAPEPGLADDGADDEADLLPPELAEAEDNSLPKMTVAEKLDLARAHAEEAAAARSRSRIPLSKTRSAHGDGDARSGAGASLAFGLDGAADVDGDRGEQDDTLGKMQSPVLKRTKIRGRPKKRRKSTLSPEELEELMVGAEGEG